MIPLNNNTALCYRRLSKELNQFQSIYEENIVNIVRKCVSHCPKQNPSYKKFDENILYDIDCKKTSAAASPQIKTEQGIRRERK